MHYLRLSSIFLLLFLSCSAPFKKLGFQLQPASSAFIYKPEFKKALYRCIVDGRYLFKKFHLSGLLIFKSFENGSTRVVFQNEMGFSFFDFEWDKNDSFRVNSIIPQLNKTAVIKTLRKDFQLLLMKDLNKSSEKTALENGKQINRFELEKGFAYFIARKLEAGNPGYMLSEIEVAGKTKITSMQLYGKKSENDLPDSVLINHHKANFTIQLTKMNSYVDG